MALQDWAVLGFHSFMWLRIALAPDSPSAALGRRLALVLLAPTALSLFVTRSGVLPRGRVRALTYRIGLFAPMVGSYFTLKWYLPALQPRLLDQMLLRVDQLLFGETPSVYLDALVSPISVEWFAFFYYSHFYLLALYLIPSLFIDTGRRLYELMFGSMLVIALGHALYTFVPGLGPYAVLSFERELMGGFWWAQVKSAVDAAGAQLDIFPSLHTAFPVFFSLHAARHRSRGIYRYIWLPTGFIAANIVIATMFLRWHYAVDVLAGTALAAGAHQLTRWAAARECSNGCDGSRQPVWEPLR